MKESLGPISGPLLGTIRTRNWPQILEPLNPKFQNHRTKKLRNRLFQNPTLLGGGVLGS